jgi:hypothetical protein
LLEDDGVGATIISINPPLQLSGKMRHRFINGSVGVGLRKVRSWALPCLVGFLFGGNPRIKPPQVKHLFKTMQFNVDVNVRDRTKPTLLHQDLKRSQRTLHPEQPILIGNLG